MSTLYFHRVRLSFFSLPSDMSSPTYCTYSACCTGRSPCCVSLLHAQRSRPRLQLSVATEPMIWALICAFSRLKTPKPRGKKLGKTPPQRSHAPLNFHLTARFSCTSGPLHTTRTRVSECKKRDRIWPYIRRSDSDVDTSAFSICQAVACDMKPWRSDGAE